MKSKLSRLSILGVLSCVSTLSAADCHWQDSLNGIYRYHATTSVGTLVFTKGDFYTHTTKGKKSRGVVDINPLNCVATLIPLSGGADWVIGLTNVEPITKLAYSGEFVGGSMTRLEGK